MSCRCCVPCCKMVPGSAVGWRCNGGDRQFVTAVEVVEVTVW